MFHVTTKRDGALSLFQLLLYLHLQPVQKCAMRFTSWLLSAAALLTTAVFAEEGAETYRYEVCPFLNPPPTVNSSQSDITRLRSLVIHSLYSHKDVFLRELLSNSNDALEKLRLTALTDRDVMKAGEGNVTIEVQINEGGDTGSLILRGELYFSSGYEPADR